jgi:hypothetical protein
LRLQFAGKSLLMVVAKIGQNFSAAYPTGLNVA